MVRCSLGANQSAGSISRDELNKKLALFDPLAIFYGGDGPRQVCNVCGMTIPFLVNCLRVETYK